MSCKMIQSALVHLIQNQCSCKNTTLQTNSSCYNLNWSIQWLYTAIQLENFDQDHWNYYTHLKQMLIISWWQGHLNLVPVGCFADFDGSTEQKALMNNEKKSFLERTKRITMGVCNLQIIYESTHCWSVGAFKPVQRSCWHGNQEKGFKLPKAERRHVLCVGVGGDQTHAAAL